MEIHANVAKFVTGQVTFHHKRQNSYNDRRLNINRRVVLRNLDALSELIKISDIQDFLAHAQRRIFRIKWCWLRFILSGCPVHIFYRSTDNSEAFFSGFPQSFPQIKISHSLLLPRHFQFTLNLSFGDRWPELREGWLEN